MSGRWWRRELLRAVGAGSGLFGVGGLVGTVPSASAQEEASVVDVLSADASAFPIVSLNVLVDTDAGRSGELSEAAFRVTEDGTERALESFEFTSSALDVVFVFDDTGSMLDEIAEMKAGVTDLTGGIAAAEIDARYALVSFKDSVERDLELTRERSRLTDAVDALEAAGGGTGPEANFDAIVEALGSDFRPEAQKVVVDITDADSHWRGDGSGVADYTLDEVANRLRERGAAYVAVAPDREDPNASKKVLAEAVDGLWIDLDRSAFDRVLERIEALVTTTYVLEYRTELPRETAGTVEVIVDGTDVGTVRDTTTVEIPRAAPSTDSDETDDEMHTLMITGNAPTEYVITVDGTLEPATLAGDFAADDEDVVTTTAEGYRSTSDVTGPAPRNAGEHTYLGDRFRFTGSVEELDLAPDGADVNVYLDEVNWPRADVANYADPGGSQHTLTIAANGPVEYTLTVDGTLEPDTLGGDFAAEDDQELTRDGGQWTARDQTGPSPANTAANTYLGDRFHFTGDVTRLDVPSGVDAPDVNLYYDEHLVTRDGILSGDPDTSLGAP